MRDQNVYSITKRYHTRSRGKEEAREKEKDKNAKQSAQKEENRVTLTKDPKNDKGQHKRITFKRVSWDKALTNEERTQGGQQRMKEKEEQKGEHTMKRKRDESEEARNKNRRIEMDNSGETMHIRRNEHTPTWVEAKGRKRRERGTLTLSQPQAYEEYTKIYVDTMASVSVVTNNVEMTNIQKVNEGVVVANSELMTLKERGIIMGKVKTIEGESIGVKLDTFRSDKVPTNLGSLNDLKEVANSIYINLNEIRKKRGVIIQYEKANCVWQKSHIVLKNGVKVQIHFEPDGNGPHVRLYKDKQKEGNDESAPINRESQETENDVQQSKKSKETSAHKEHEKNDKNEKQASKPNTQKGKQRGDMQVRTTQKYRSLRTIPLLRNVKGAIYPSKLNKKSQKPEPEEKSEKGRLYADKHKNLTWDELHKMTGHPSTNIMKIIAKDIAMSRENMKSKDPCEICAQYEKRKGHNGKIPRGKQPNEIVYMDIKIKNNYGKGKNGYMGHVTMVDSYTHVVYTYAIKTKNQAIDAVKNWVAEKGKIGMLKPDSESVLCKGAMKDASDEMGIDMNPTTPHCQETNIAERYHQMIWLKVNKMIEGSTLPEAFWPYALKQAEILHNNLPCNIEGEITTPNLKWGMDPIEIITLVEFGEKVLWMAEPRDPDKTKGWRIAWYLQISKNGHAIYDNESQQVRIVRHVKIAKQNKEQHNTQEGNLKMNRNKIDEAVDKVNSIDNDMGEIEKVSEKYIEKMPKEKVQQEMPNTTNRLCSIYLPENWYEEEVQRELNEQNMNVTKEKVFIPEATKQALKSHGLEIADDINKEWFPKGINIDVEKLVKYVHTSHKHGVFSMQNEKYKPRNQKERDLIENVNKGKTKVCTPRQARMTKFGHLVIPAMETEIEMFEERGLYKKVLIEKVPKDAEKLRFFWIIEMKWDTKSGTFIKVKGRCLANGKHATYDVESYAPTVDASRLRVLLAVAAAMSWCTFEIDITGAYTHAKHEQQTYMYPPVIPGRENDTKYMWKLIKNIYGLKQGARAFYEWLREQMESMGFVTSVYDDAIFIGDSSIWKQKIIVAFHVDDGRIVCETEKVFEEFMNKVKERQITCKQEGLNNQVHAGLEIIQNKKKSIGIFQTKYNENLVEKFTGEEIGSIFQSKPKAPPCKKEIVYAMKGTKQEKIEKTLEYRQATGALLWKAISTSPHLAYYAHYYSRYNNAPTVGLYKDVIQTIQYGRKSVDEGITYPYTGGEIEITASVDSSWSDCENSKRSTYGYVAMINGAPVVWGVKRSQGPMRSSAAAELHGLSKATPNILMVKNFVKELGVMTSEPIKIQQDNTACAAIALKPSVSPMDRHQAIAHEYVRYLLRIREITIEQTKSAQMIADGLTKALGTATYEKFKQMINISDKNEFEQMN